MNTILIALTALLSTSAVAFSAESRSACERQRESMRLVSHAALVEIKLQSAYLIFCNGKDSEECKKTTEDAFRILLEATGIYGEVEEMLEAESVDECPASIDDWLNAKSRLVRTLEGPSTVGVK